jgi:hypothetical protein
MNEGNKPNDIERLLRRARPAQPSDELRSQVFRAAGKAWAEHPGPVLWRIAAWRLAVSAAAAILIVILADAWSDFAVTRSRSPTPVAVAREFDSPLDEPQWADMEPAIPYASLIGHTAVASRPMTSSAGPLLDHIEELQDALSQISVEE